MSETISTTQDPAAIERDIRRTQDEMSRTVDRIGDQLTPRNLINSLLDKAEDNNIDARYLLDGARRNPIALAMIAGGAIWLVSDSDAKLPTFGLGASRDTSTRTTESEADPFHRDYIAHMERLEPSEGEDDLAYQRRRDLHRANYFVLDRGHEEDEHSFRQRLDDAAQSFRDKRRAWSDSASDAANSARESASQAANSVRNSGAAAVAEAQSAYASNPLIGGLIAAAVGAIAGTALPLTRTEDENLSSLGESARDVIGEQKDKLVQAAREKKDELLAQVQDAGNSDQGASSTASIPAYSATSPQPVN